ncbi:MAG: hypothetical protein CMP07_03900 [Xanthomonadales bacterium]|nr:hypothetical protein [Xanthomonadales bacterium]|tara:strand:+ start:3488 stop:4876 length:1389 start_codon:yes stop_codon:yes gene_type:complete
MINISRNSVRISFFLFLAATVFPQAAYAQIFDLDSATRIVSSQFCVSITAADANQDGRPDVAITCNLRSDGLLNVDDTGAWTSTIIWRGHREPRNQVALSDIDLDGDKDLLYARGDRNGSSGWYINEGGGFQTHVPGFGANAQGIAVGDLNGDSFPDAVLARRTDSRVYINDSTGNFVLHQSIPIGTDELGAALADIDNDGDLDLSLANRVLKNNGAGEFIDSAQNLNVGGTFRTWGRTFIDVDGDGDADLVIGEKDLGAFVLLNDGSGGFSWTGQRFTTSYSVDLGDVDGDGHVDLLTSDPIDVYLGDGTGWFGPSVQRISVGSSGHHEVELSDINLDGKVDLLSTTSPAGYPTAYLNTSDWCDYGPESQPVDFIRTSGKPHFQVLEWESCGGPGKLLLTSMNVASARVFLNGEELLGPSDFRGHPLTEEIEIDLPEGANSMAVKLMGRPGEQLIFEFEEE